MEKSKSPVFACICGVYYNVIRCPVNPALARMSNHGQEQFGIVSEYDFLLFGEYGMATESKHGSELGKSEKPFPSGTYAPGSLSVQSGDDEGHFLDLIENVPGVIFSLSPEGVLTYLNPAFEHLTEWPREDWTGRRFEELIAGDHRGEFTESLSNILNGKTAYTFESSINLSCSRSLTVEVTARPRFENGEVLEILGTIRDIAQRKRTDEMLELQEERIRSLYKISAEPGMGIDAQLMETIKTGSRVLGLEIAVIGHITGNKYTVLYCHDTIGKVTQGLEFDLDKTYCKITLAANDVIALDHVGKSKYKNDVSYTEFGFETYIAVPLRINGSIFGTLNFASPYPRGAPFTKADKDFVRLMARWISTMIERKQAETMLKEKEALYRTIVENAHDLIVETTFDGKFLYASSNHKEILGYEPEELLGTRVFDLMHPEDRPAVLSEFMKGVESFSTGRAVFRYRHKNGEWRWFESTGKPFRTPAGEIRGIVDTREITERIKKEEQIKQSLKEKEALLMEIHHRVKNNLQIISSLLNLQSDYVKGSDSLRLINECQSRISAIAMIHERLYQSKNLGEVKMADYIDSLTRNLMIVYEYGECPVDVRIKADDVKVSIDAAVPCGLIINELFSNCLKHAFNFSDSNGQGQKRCEIFVEIHSRSDGNILLSVGDNGIGFPKGLDYRNTESLGLQLVCTLAEQLNGTMELLSLNGTTFNIKFPREEN